MKLVCTGQVGLDKQRFLERVAAAIRARGSDAQIFNVGRMMYGEAPDVAPERILDLPLGRLNHLRRSVFKDILARSHERPHAIVNTHATFRWRHGLFYAFDIDQMTSFDADLYVVLLDNVDRVHARLIRDGHDNHTLKDLMVWREEEIMASELLSHVVRGHGKFYLWARGFDDEPADALARLMLEPGTRKAYLSFPMTHVMNMPETLATIEAFRKQMKELFICFDPGDIEEKHLCKMAIAAAEQGEQVVRYGPPGDEAAMDTRQLLEIIPDIDGQIYTRDFKLIDQSDMIVSLVPAMPDGRPGLSSGVERELQHAHEATREVYVIWQPSAEPSPFITETATRVFRSTDEAVAFFRAKGHQPREQSLSLFRAARENGV
jgi:adenylate kinase